LNKKSTRYKLLSLLLIAASLAACTNNSETETTVAAKTASAQTAVAAAVTTASSGDNKTVSAATSGTVAYDKDDAYSDWKNENPNYIELKGTTATLNGTGAALSGNQIMIMQSGVYVMSGQLDNGQIIVDIQNKGTVRLVLNGAEIHSKDSAPIYVKNADKAILSLQEGTKNVVSDGAAYADTSDDAPSAAIFSKDDLTINGTGQLTVHGSYNNGIMSKDDLKITGGTIEIHSADDGLVGRDIVAVQEGTVIIEAGGDGIKSTNDTDASKGFVSLDGGAYSIKAGADGIQAQTSVLIAGGKYTITTGGGSANGTVKAAEAMPNPRAAQTQTQTTAAAAADKQSAKGIKAAADISISGGTFKIDSSDDAVHSNNSLNLTGGEMFISSGDDGLHADASILIGGGKIDIAKSYEGVESKLITISGGETHVVSSDDGINVGGGNDGSSVNGRPGQNSFSTSGDSKLIINGGYVSVDAQGDGLDANGAIAMTGGTVVVNGPTGNNNGALDYDAGFEMTGGFLVAAGSAGMAQAPSEQSAQYSVMMSFSSIQQAGAIVSLKDSKDYTIATFAPKKAYQTVVISSPELKKDGAYTLYTGGTSTGTVTDGLYSKGVNQGGTKIVSFTVSGNVTYLNESGVTTGRTSMQPGGGGGAGGPKGRGFGGIEA
jgi:hypothetical protein